MKFKALMLVALALTVGMLLRVETTQTVAQSPGLPGTRLRQVRFHLDFGQSRSIQTPVANCPIFIVVATTNSMLDGRQLGPFVGNYNAVYDSHTAQWSTSAFEMAGTAPPDGEEGPNLHATVQFNSGGEIRVANTDPGSSYDVCANVWY